jgi:hypothetical protein
VYNSITIFKYDHYNTVFISVLGFGWGLGWLLALRPK